MGYNGGSATVLGPRQLDGPLLIPVTIFYILIFLSGILGNVSVSFSFPPALLKGDYWLAMQNFRNSRIFFHLHEAKNVETL